MIRGIQRTQVYKYLGMEFRLTKASMLKGLKAQLSRNLGALRSKTLSMTNFKLQDLIVTYTVRSLMTYFVAPVVAAGIAKIEDFRTIEMKALRSSLGLSTMISNEKIENWTNWTALNNTI